MYKKVTLIIFCVLFLIVAVIAGYRSKTKMQKSILYENAISAIQKGNYEQAEQNLNELEKYISHPDNVSLLLKYVDLLRAEQSGEDIVTLFSKACGIYNASSYDGDLSHEIHEKIAEIQNDYKEYNIAKEEEKRAERRKKWEKIMQKSPVMNGHKDAGSGHSDNQISDNSYDEGYDDVYDDKEYDVERYYSDSQYAHGVDDALDEWEDYGDDW